LADLADFTLRTRGGHFRDSGSAPDQRSRKDIWRVVAAGRSAPAQTRPSEAIRRPIPPEIFADFGDAMKSDSQPIVVTIDANAAIESNRYPDPIKTNGRWVEQMKPS
jgi:hypothetical protein